MDLLLDAGGDLDVSTNDFAVVDGIQAIRQELQIRYRFFLGEWFLDTTEGVPYIRDVLKKNPNEAQVRALLASVATSTPGINKVQSIDLSLDNVTRTLTVELDVEATVGGELVYEPFILEVEV